MVVPNKKLTWISNLLIVSRKFLDENLNAKRRWLNILTSLFIVIAYTGSMLMRLW